MNKNRYPIPDWSKEDFYNLFLRASKGDKISQELYSTLFNKHILPELEEYGMKEVN
tara:strand:+ start:392 stop:559 length:168 start_codon:yes stop_codon:yes gene_type:complete